MKNKDPSNQVEKLISQDRDAGQLSFPDNGVLPVRTSVAWLVGGLLTFGLFRLFVFLPGLIDPLFTSWINPVLLRSISLVVGVVPFSFLELLIAGYAAFVATRTWRAIRSVAGQTRSPRNALSSGCLRAIRHGGILLTLFYFMWGFNYARRPLRERLGWPVFEEPGVAELARLAERSVALANMSYLELHDTTDSGSPTRMPDNLLAFDRSIEGGWVRATDVLQLDGHFARTYGPTKRLILTPVVARFGISGFFFPWTGEANVLRTNPAVLRPQSMAHEKAHQRGVGPEEEASFLGYVAGSLAADPLARYSARVFAQLQLLRVLADTDLEKAREIAAGRHPGVQRDIDDGAAYWERRRGLGTRVGSAVNHQFLRANRVRGGIANYRLSVQLLITYMERFP